MPPYKTLLIRPSLVGGDVFHQQAYELGRRLLNQCAFIKADESTISGETPLPLSRHTPSSFAGEPAMLMIQLVTTDECGCNLEYWQGRVSTVQEGAECKILCTRGFGERRMNEVIRIAEDLFEARGEWIQDVTMPYPGNRGCLCRMEEDTPADPGRSASARSDSTLYDAFECMVDEDAERLLAWFLAEGPAGLADIAPTGNLDYSLETLPARMEACASRLTTTTAEDEKSDRNHVAGPTERQSGLFEYTSEAKRLITGCSYYFGECFIRAHPHLRWASGNPLHDTGAGPALVGFANKLEMPVLLVVDTLFGKRIENPAAEKVFDKIVRQWERVAG